MTAHSAPTVAATAAYRRESAPDLARGAMLLFIALANIPAFLYAAPTGGGTRPTGGSLADQIVSVAGIIAIDGRTYPMFAFLFGLGMVQFWRTRIDRGLAPETVGGMLGSRHWWLLAFGAVHGLLLFSGDILGTYALCGLILTALLWRRGNGTVAGWAFGLLGLPVLVGIGALVAGLLLPVAPAPDGPTGLQAVVAESNYLTSIGLRAPFWISGTLGGALLTPVAPAILLGWLAGREGWLTDPRHRGLLVRTAAIGIPLAWLGAVPTALTHLGILEVPAWTFSGPDALTGLAGGLGYVAVFALLGQRLQDRTPGPVRAIAALGERSLSGYLLQSLIFAPLLCAWGLGLGGRLGATAAAGIAVATWLGSVLIAYLLGRAGRRGPAEVLLRRLTYGRHR